MLATTSSPAVQEELQVLLDGSPVKPPSGRRSLNGLRCYLESIALQRQRILFSFNVDGAPVSLAHHENHRIDFFKVEAVTMDPEHMPLYLVCSASEQTARARSETVSAAEILVSQDCSVAREFWWNLILALRQPLLTLNLISDSTGDIAPAGASLSQLRKWQLEQLGGIIRDVDEACWSEDVNLLRNALWARVLPWLDNLAASLDLLRETLLSAAFFQSN